VVAQALEAKEVSKDVDNKTVGTRSFSDMKLSRFQGHWLVEDIPSRRTGEI